MAQLGSLVIELSANVARLQSDLGKASAMASKFADGTKRALGALGVGISLVGISAFVNKTIEAADRLNDLRARTGLTGQQLLVLEGAALRSGAGIDTVSEVTSKLARRLAEAEKGTGDAAAAYQAMGINVKRATGELKSVDEILREVGSKFRGYEDGANKAALATAALGKGGDKLIPVVEAIEETESRFKRLGITIDEDLITAADKFKDTMEDLRSINDQFSRQLAAALLPHMQQLADAMVEAQTSGDSFKGTVDALLLPVKVLASGFIALYAAIAAAADAFVGFEAAKQEAFRGNVKRAIEELAIAGQKVSDRFSSAGGVIRKFFEDAAPRQPAGPRQGRGSAPGIPDLAAGKAGLDALRKLQEQQTKLSLDLIKDAASREAQLLDAKYQDNLVSEGEYWSQKIGIVKAATEAEIRVLNLQADRQKKLVEEAAKKGRATKEYFDAVGTLEETLAKRNKLELDFEQTAKLTYIQAQRAADDYRRSVEDLNIELLELKGNGAEAAGRRFDSQNEVLQKKFSANNDAGSLRLLDTVKRQRVAQAEFNDAREQQDVITTRLGIAEERLQNSLRTGAISELSALKKTGEARKGAVAQLEAMVQAQEAIARASGNDKLVLAAEQARASLERLRGEMDLLAQRFDTIIGESFSDAFADFISGTKSAKDAFKSFADSVSREISRLVSQSLATDLLKLTGGGGSGGSGVGGFLANLLGGGGSSFMNFGGGAIPLEWTGAGFAEGTDYVPRTGIAKLHKGEAVIPADQNRMGGVNVTIVTQDADSFRRSRGQVASEFERILIGSRRRNL